MLSPGKTLALTKKRGRTILTKTTDIDEELESLEMLSNLFDLEELK